MPQGHGSCIIKFLCSDDKSNCGLLPPFRPQGLLMWCEEYEYNYWLQIEPFRFLCSAVAVRPSVRPSARPTNNNTTQRKVRDPLSKKSNTNTVGCWRIQWKFSVSNRFLLLFVRFIVKVVLLIRSTNYPFYCVYSSPSDLYYEKWVSLRQQWQAVVNIANICRYIAGNCCGENVIPTVEEEWHYDCWRHEILRRRNLNHNTSYRWVNEINLSSSDSTFHWSTLGTTKECTFHSDHICFEFQGKLV